MTQRNLSLINLHGALHPKMTQADQEVKFFVQFFESKDATEMKLNFSYAG